MWPTTHFLNDTRCPNSRVQNLALQLLSAATSPKLSSVILIRVKETTLSLSQLWNSYYPGKVFLIVKSSKPSEKSNTQLSTTTNLGTTTLKGWSMSLLLLSALHLRCHLWRTFIVLSGVFNYFPDSPGLHIARTILLCKAHLHSVYQS